MKTDMILCPVDYSEASRRAADYAVALAHETGAAVVGLHVSQPATVTSPAVIVCGEIACEAAGTGSKDLRQRLLEQFGEQAVSTLRVCPALAFGSPAEAIAEYVRESGIDLVVMGTRGSSGLRHLVLGSVAEQVIRTAPAPVLVVPPHAPATPRVPFRRVLVATDFSSASIAALRTALSLAPNPATAFTVAHVLDEPGENELFVARFHDVHRHAMLFETSVREHLTRLTCAPFQERHRPDIRIVRGAAAAQILALAREIEADLIVMGTHGRPALDLAVFGSVTNDVVRQAHCPVLIASR